MATLPNKPCLFSHWTLTFNVLIEACTVWDVALGFFEVFLSTANSDNRGSYLSWITQVHLIIRLIQISLEALRLSWIFHRIAQEFCENLLFLIWLCIIVVSSLNNNRLIKTVIHSEWKHVEQDCWEIKRGGTNSLSHFDKKILKYFANPCLHIIRELVILIAMKKKVKYGVLLHVWAVLGNVFSVRGVKNIVKNGCSHRNLTFTLAYFALLLTSLNHKVTLAFERLLFESVLGWDGQL